MLLNAIVGAVLALFIAWGVGHIMALRAQLGEARKVGGEISAKLGNAEIAKEAIETHCNELRNIVAQLSARPPIVYFTDEQVMKLTKAIFEMANPPKNLVN